MDVTIWTYIGVFASAYWLVFKLVPWIEGEGKR